MRRTSVQKLTRSYGGWLVMGLAMLFCGVHFRVDAQQLKVGGAGVSVDPAAILQLESSTKGFLLPRVADTSSIAQPIPAGLMIYSTAQNSVYVYGGSTIGWLGFIQGGFVQGGNSFGSVGILGTRDGFDLRLIANNMPLLVLSQATGNVGIGTLAPQNKLEITQGSSGHSGLRFSNLNNMYVVGAGLNAGGNKFLSLDASGDVILDSVAGTDITGFYAQGGNDFPHVGTSLRRDTLGSVNGTDTLMLVTNRVPRVSITPTGLVGIGTIAPTAALSVVGGVRVSGNDTLLGNDSIGGKLNVGGVTTHWGNVGIGTSSPTASLSVVGGVRVSGNDTLLGNDSIGGTLKVGGNVTLWGVASGFATLSTDSIVTIGSTTSPGLLKKVSVASLAGSAFYAQGGNNFGHVGTPLRRDSLGSVNGTDTLMLVTNSVPRVSITPTGLVGIGTIAPTAALSVVGGVRVSGNDTLLGNDSIGGKLNVGGVTTHWGNVGIGTSSPTASLSVVGGVRVSGNDTLLGNDSIGGVLRVGGAVTLWGVASGFATLSTDSIVTIGGATSPGLLKKVSVASLGSLFYVQGGNDFTHIGTVLRRDSLGSVNSTDTLMLVTNRVPRVSITPTGLVGIGTIAPTAALSVVGGVRVSGNDTILGNDSIGGKLNIGGVTTHWGNVGIGTSVPTTALSVVGGVRVSGNDTLLGNDSIGGVLRVGGNVTLWGVASGFATLSTDSIVTIGGATSPGLLKKVSVASLGNTLFYIQGGNNFVHVGTPLRRDSLGSTNSTDTLMLVTNSVPRVSITPLGLVGIGTIAPTAALSVVGGVRVSGNDTLLGNDSIGGKLNIGGVTTHWGNVGIGTSSPTTALSVVGGVRVSGNDTLVGNDSIGGVLRVGGNVTLWGVASGFATLSTDSIVTIGGATSPGLLKKVSVASLGSLFYVQGGNNFGHVGTSLRRDTLGSTNSTDTLMLVTNRVPRVSITPTGLVGIGTIAPTAALSVVGGVRVSGNDTILGNDSIGGKLNIGGVTTHWGNVGIGTSVPTTALSVVGGVRVSGNDTLVGNDSIGGLLRVGGNVTLWGVPSGFATLSTDSIVTIGGATSPGLLKKVQPGSLGFYIQGGNDFGHVGTPLRRDSLGSVNGTDTLMLVTNSLPRVSITPLGLVGIGTTAPTATLSVVGGVRVSGNDTILGNDSIGGKLNVGGVTTHWGNVGIGTATPNNKLEISQGSNGNSGLRFSNVNNTNVVGIGMGVGNSKFLALNASGDVILDSVPNVDSSNVYVQGGNSFPHVGTTLRRDSLGSINSTDTLMLITNSLPRVSITPAGLVGIGTINPLGLLHTSRGSDGTGLTAAQAGVADVIVQSLVNGAPARLLLASNNSLGGTLTGNSIEFWGSANGGGMGPAARISTETLLGTAVGQTFGNLVFYISNNATTPSESMRLTRDNRLWLGTGAVVVDGDNNFALSVKNTFAPVSPSIIAPSGMLRLKRDGTSGTKYAATVDFNIGSYATSINAQTRLDMVLGNGGTNSTDATVMTLLGNGNVGIGTTNPLGLLHTSRGSNGTGLTAAQAGVADVIVQSLANGAPARLLLASNNSLGGILTGNSIEFWSNANGGGMGQAAGIGTVSAQGSASGQTVGNLVFYTSNDATAPGEAMRLTNDNRLLVGTAAGVGGGGNTYGDNNFALSVKNTFTPINPSNVAPVGVMRLKRDGTNDGKNPVKDPVTVDFNIGSYATSVLSQTRLDMVLGNANTSGTDVTVMTLLGNGNVGIGVTNPTYQLQVAGAAQFTSTSGHPFTFSGTTDMTTGAWLRNDGNLVLSNADGDMYFGYKGNSKSIFFKVAPNSTADHTTLTLSALGNTVLILGGGISNTGTWRRFGTHGGPLALFTAGTGLSDNNPQFLFSSKGFLGIGTTDPQYPVDIPTNGATVFPQHPYICRPYNHQFGDYWNTTNAAYSNLSAAIRTFGSIVCEASGYFVSTDWNSDYRIKKDFRKTNSSEDLLLLSRLSVTNYKYIDSLKSGVRWHKMLIAQEADTVYPLAVSHRRDYVPNIYAASESVSWSNGLLTLRMSKSVALQVGDKVRVYVILLSDTLNESLRELEVVAVAGNRFSGKLIGGALTGGIRDVFVYGKEVSDFASVDYNAVAMLNVSATQELHKQLQAEQKEGAERDKLIATLEGLVQKLMEKKRIKQQ